MTGSDGLDTNNRILEFQRAQIVILTSGYSETNREKEVGQADVKIYLHKSYVV